MEALVEGTLLREDGTPYKKMILNVPPRHGKTFSKDLFVLFCILKDPLKRKVISASFSKDLSIISSRTIRNKIMEEKTSPLQITVQDIFPGVEMSDDNANVNQWSVKYNGQASFFTFKAISTNSSVTGTGSNLSICDDLISSAETAHNEAELEKIWDWYWNTFSSREEKGSVSLVIGTPWSENDVISRLQRSEDAHEWLVLKLPAYDKEKDEMLCEDLLDKAQYERLKRNMDAGIFSANYDCEPISQRGKLYKRFMTYENRPETFEKIFGYIDTADTGKDFTAGFVAGVKNGQGYILDAYASRESMETTEKEVAEMLVRNKVEIARVESNNGGRGFARQVQRIMWEEFQSRFTTVETFHQSKNKQARILTYSSFIENNIFFPEQWKSMYPEVYEQLNKYQRIGKNAHDDIPDALTGVAETIEEQGFYDDDLDIKGVFGI